MFDDISEVKLSSGVETELDAMSVPNSVVTRIVEQRKGMMFLDRKKEHRVFHSNGLTVKVRMNGQKAIIVGVDRDSDTRRFREDRYERLN